MLAGLALLALGGLVVWSLMREADAPADLVRFAIATPDTAPLRMGLGRDLAISPDGTQIIYDSFLPGGSRRQLYRRPIGQLAGEALRGSEDGGAPFVSPDGQWVGFQGGIGVTPGTLQKVSILGGPAVTLATLPSDITGASWGADDQIIVGTAFGGLFRVPGGGGEPEALTTPDAEHGEVSHRRPFIVPNRQAVLFVVHTGGAPARQLAVFSLETGEVTRLGLAGTAPHYVKTGHLLYGAADGSVRAVPFDDTSLDVTGNPVPVIDADVVKSSGSGNFSVSDNGTLVYVPIGDGVLSPRTLVWVDPDGREDPLADLSLAAYPQSVDVAPDGTRVALEVADDPNAPVETDVWTYDLARGTLNRLTTAPGQDRTPLWTPDGRQVVFGSNRDGAVGLYRQNADGTGDAERVYLDDEATSLTATTWSSEGDTLVVTRRMSQQDDLALLSMEGEPAPEMLLESEFSETQADVSPDGAWIAYESDRSGRNEVYVERFPDLGDRQLISIDGGQQPRWSPDGRALFYLGPQANRLMIVPVTTGTGFTVGTPDTLVEGQFWDYFGRSSYDVAPDGRLMIIKRGAETSEDVQPPQINVVIDWFQELTERVPVPLDDVGRIPTARGQPTRGLQPRAPSVRSLV